MIATMPRPRPPHLHRELTSLGKAKWYVRIGKGPRTRLTAPFGSEEFEQQYRDALEGKKPQKSGAAARGTLGWLWNLYRGSRAWTNLSPATRKQRENIMKPVLASAATKPLSTVTKTSVNNGVKKREATPTQAKHFVTSLRGMYEWAIAADLVKTDPTHGVGFKRSSKEAKSGGFPVWTEEDIATFELRWPRGTRQRLAFDILLYTGLRRGDAVRVGRQHVKDGIISLQTEKTGMWVHLPIQPELQATLEAGPLGDLAFIGNPMNGNPIRKEALGNFFREACDLAGIKKSAHGLRKAAATNAADNGATESELEALFGWSGGQMAALYTRSANRKRLSTGAAQKMARTKTETSIPAIDHKSRAAGEKDQ